MINRIITNRWVHVILLLMMLFGAVSYSDSNARWRTQMRAFVFDGLNKYAPREPTDRVVIIDIDDDSLRKIGQWPWPRTVLADLVLNLKALGASAIVFDGVLAEPDRSSPRSIARALEQKAGTEKLVESLQSLPDNDEVLAKAMKEVGNFVAGFTYGTYARHENHKKPRIKQGFRVKRAQKKVLLKKAGPFGATANFLPLFEKAAAGNGSFMAIADEDGVLRRAGLIFTDGKQLYPSLSLEAIRVDAGKPTRGMLIAPAGEFEDEILFDTAFHIKYNDYDIPVEANGSVYVYYRKFDKKGDDYISAYKAISPQHHEQIKSGVEGRIALIGASAEGLKDLRNTALEKYQPGVEIHANVIEQIIQGRYLLRPDMVRGVEAIFIFIAGLIMIILAPFISIAVVILLCMAMVALAFGASVIAYIDHGLLIDPFYPSLAIVLIFLVSFLLTYIRVENERRQVRSAFGLYISPDFMKDLTKNPDKLKLGGEIRDLTVLFSDIRSFTSISEGLTPEELIQLMNDFLTPMSDLVMKNRGTIDKYMGDAMMAFWNAPLDDEEHARNACKAALGMCAALAPVNDLVCMRAAEAGRTPILLKAGIGINSGPCAVGNMGSRQRFAYSTLGDAVNLASRLEGQTKTYGVDILIGESTWAAVPEMATLELDLIKVKGKEKAERVFVLLGDADVAQSEEFQALAKSNAALMACYRSADFKGAQKYLEVCRKKDLYELGVAYDLYEMRIKDMLENPPGADWDGVFVATTK